MSHRLQTLVLRSTKFVRVSALGTLVETVILWVLAELVFVGYEGRYIVAPAISYECAVISNFLLSYFWTWKENVGHTLSDYFKRFTAYNIVTFLVFLVKLALLASIGSMTGWHPVVCNVLALLATGVLNFVVQDSMVFRPNSTATEVPEV